MKILLVHHRLPYPLDNGMDKLRFNLIRTLKIKYNITLVVPIAYPLSVESEKIIKNIVDKLILIPVNDIFRRTKLLYIKRLFKQVFLCIPSYITNYYSHKFNKELTRLIQNEHYDYINYLSDYSAIYSLRQNAIAKTIIGPMDDKIKTSYDFFRFSENLKQKIGGWIE